MLNLYADLLLNICIIINIEQMRAILYFCRNSSIFMTIWSIETLMWNKCPV